MRSWVAAAAGAVGAALGAGVMYLGSDGFLYGGRERIDLDRWARAEDAWAQNMMPGARWATEEVCDADLPCIQAVQSETLTMFRFDDREDAVAVAREFAGEAYLSGWIVVHFERDGLTAEERREFAYTLDCLNVGVAEGGLEC